MGHESSSRRVVGDSDRAQWARKKEADEVSEPSSKGKETRSRRPSRAELAPYIEATTVLRHT